MVLLMVLPLDSGVLGLKSFSLDVQFNETWRHKMGINDQFGFMER
jgi:hypothetical protein